MEFRFGQIKANTKIDTKITRLMETNDSSTPKMTSSKQINNNKALNVSLSQIKILIKILL